jgi:hypothetical protein
MPKPILVIKMPDQQSAAEAIQMLKKKKREWADYHILVMACHVSLPEVQVFYEKDQVPLDTAEFKKLLEENCIKTQPTLLTPDIID